MASRPVSRALTPDDLQNVVTLGLAPPLESVVGFEL